MLVLEGKMYLKGELKDCCVGIEDGRIVEIKKTLRGDMHKDYGDHVVLPGGIDIHVHFRDPGMTHKEDFESGSISAGFGGVTTVFDMPNTVPPTTTLESYSMKVKLAKKKAFVDFGIIAGLTGGRDVQRLARVAPAFKLYLAPTTGIEAAPIEGVKQLLRDYPEDYPPLIAHAESPEKFKISKVTNLVEYDLCRPVEAELASVRELTDIGKGLHFTHVTSPEVLEMVGQEKFTLDATPHHLLLDCRDSLGAKGKVNPPLRESGVRDALWEAFKAGRVGMVASDHAPHTQDEKETNFDDAPSGMPGVETMIPLLLRKVRSWDLPLDRMIDAVCERPARLMNVPKGRIEIGMDADLMVVDLRTVDNIRGSRLHSKCGWSAFEGWEAVFPHAVYLRGNLVIDGGEVVEDLLGGQVSVKSPLMDVSKKE